MTTATRTTTDPPADDVSVPSPSSPPGDWLEENQRYLAAALDAVSASLAAHLRRAAARHPAAGSGTSDAAPLPDGGHPPRAAPRPYPDRMSRPASLDVLCDAFGLSSFERDVLVMCAGVELDASFAELCAGATAGPGGPTFGLALAALPDAHWSALTPEGPLRQWRLVEPTGHDAVTTARLRIDERVLHFLTGLAGPDPKLAGILRSADESVPVTPAQHEVAHALADCWRAADGPVPALTGADPRTRAAVAGSAAHELGLRLELLDPTVLPADPAARMELARLLERESVLASAAFCVDCDDGAAWAATDAVTAAVRAPIVLSAPDPPRLRRRGTGVLEVPRPTSAEQRDLWRDYAGPDAPIEPLVAAFDLDAGSIRDAVATVRGRAAQGRAMALRTACRAIDRADLAALAQRVESSATWQDLVLPPAQLQTLRLLTAHARHRVTVYDDWGLSMGRTTGLGSTVVFSGPSGTGKTFAAEIIAGDLELDLFRVDLSAVVSKYIGETEKNLRRVFDAADHGAAVLLFDEADALFGKRTEVRDSHDRYANVEVSYLLQRMEAYRGLAILTTNMADALDAAFLRRVRFAVAFPFPDRRMQRELWLRAFPPSTPTEGLDPDVLATLDMAGGTIRNVAVNAAVLAAEAGEQVRMSHVVRAARIEASKLGRPMPSLRGQAES